MKATDLLESQHRKVEATFKRLETDRANTAALLTDLATDLAAHMVIEQDLFYPVAKAAKLSMVLKNYEEHAVAEFELKRLLKTDPQDATFPAKLAALKGLIEAHVKEEEKILFPKIEKFVDAEELRALGKQMKARFDEVVERGYEAVLANRAQKSADSQQSLAAR